MPNKQQYFFQLNTFCDSWLTPTVVFIGKNNCDKHVTVLFAAKSMVDETITDSGAIRFFLIPQVLNLVERSFCRCIQISTNGHCQKDEMS